MAVRSRQESRTEQTSNRRAAWPRLLNSDLSNENIEIFNLYSFELMYSLITEDILFAFVVSPFVTRIRTSQIV